MVLLAAAVCNKSGKALISRQFVELPKSRAEALLATFPKLMSSEDKQHTFIETEAVRYVYQPLDKLYVLLVTTKNSNILEDLDTLRLFSRIVPEYTTSLDEEGVYDKAFELIFAFDELVALGYKENVTLSQIRTYIEMDSHEERIQIAIRETQEREAKEAAKRKAKELQQIRRDAVKTGKSISSKMGGMGSGSGVSPPSPTAVHTYVSNEDSSRGGAAADRPAVSSASSKAMKLGAKGKDIDQFVTQLRSEGEKVAAASTSPRSRPSGATGTAAGGSAAGAAGSSAARKGAAATAGGKTTTSSNTSGAPVHFVMKEKLNVVATRHSQLKSMDVQGMMTCRVASDDLARIESRVEYDKDFGQMQTHPNFDKKRFAQDGVVALRNVEEKKLPVGTDAAVLKWSYPADTSRPKAATDMPLLINCWPETAAGGKGCDVIIEFELQNERLTLEDVLITIPLGSASGSAAHGATVRSCDGSYSQKKRGFLQWEVALIDSSNKSGSMEFHADAGKPEDYFPVEVYFMCTKTLLMPLEVVHVAKSAADTTSDVRFSTEKSLEVEKYTIE